MECFYRVKPSQPRKTLAEVRKDLFELVQGFRGCAGAKAMYSYKLLERVFKEHCDLKETKDGATVEPAAAKDIPFDALQIPSAKFRE